MFIVVVDDELSLSDLLATALRDEGHEVRTFATGEAALKTVTTLAKLPTLIILDLMLPGMSGADLAQILQRDPQFEHIPILFVTALPPNVATSQTNSKAYILYKPFALETFLALVAKLIAPP